jgi:hypothetical protein
MSESDRQANTQRIDDTPGAAGSVTEASDAAGEQNPAERPVGPAESLPGTGDRAPRPPVSGDPADTGRGTADAGDAGDRDRGGHGSHLADAPDREEKERDSRTAGGGGVPGGSGGSYVDEFRPEPVPQVPSKGRVGQAMGGAQVIPDTDAGQRPQDEPE